MFNLVDASLVASLSSLVIRPLKTATVMEAMLQAWWEASPLVLPLVSPSLLCVSWTAVAVAPALE
jgi:hypothetical protein